MFYMFEWCLMDYVLFLLCIGVVWIGQQCMILFCQEEFWGDGIYMDFFIKFFGNFCGYKCGEIGDFGFGSGIVGYMC